MGDKKINLTAEDLQAIQERQKQALNLLTSLAGGESFRTTIPARESDSDVVIGNSLHDITALTEYIKLLEAALESGNRFAEKTYDRVEALEGVLAEKDKRIQELENVVRFVIYGVRDIDAPCEKWVCGKLSSVLPGYEHIGVNGAEKQTGQDSA